ncbi:MAG: hypothetical protein Q4D78_05995 [Neisseria zoodegmatis]|uniref:hypothetical protein n=1 Tax=Neisseria zoodegmatis TaxID=326523 RepID=UPI0026F1C459|nr:hypothetical protein [Neisseria zoodegmatis]MDO5069739.1 hypothetical protein [Neisseria zoodegmatis]
MISVLLCLLSIGSSQGAPLLNPQSGCVCPSAVRPNKTFQCKLLFLNYGGTVKKILHTYTTFIPHAKQGETLEAAGYSR